MLKFYETIVSFCYYIRERRDQMQKNTIHTMFQEILITLLFLAPLFLLLLLGTIRSATAKHRLPPSPRKIPLFGNLHQLGPLPHRILYALAEKHGPLMLLHLGQAPTLIASSAPVAQEIMKAHDLTFCSRPRSKATSALFYEGKSVAVAEYGPLWRHMKKIAVLNLLSNKRVHSYRLIRREEVAAMVRKISQISSSSTRPVINMSTILYSLTNDVLCRVVFGESFREKEKGMTFHKLVEETNILLGAFSVGDFIPPLAWLDAISGFDAKLKRVSKKWNEILDEILKDYAEKLEEDDGSESTDFVRILLSIQKDPANELPLSDGNLKAVLLDMVFAAIDTSFVLLEWCMTELLRNREVLNKLQHEVRSIGKGEDMIREEDLGEMHYLRSVLKETLRLHPPAPLLVPRESMEDCCINGYDIPRKTKVLINAWAIGRDPAYWDAPEEFKPQRFLDNPIDYLGQNFNFIPFGAGRRACPGMNFAINISEIALANLMHRFDWELPDGMRTSDVSMEEAPGITIGRKENLLLVAKLKL